MSSLVFIINEENVFIATDTLVTTLEREAFMFNSKSFYIPHLKTAITGLGEGAFISEWASVVIRNLMVTGINGLNDLTP